MKVLTAPPLSGVDNCGRTVMVVVGRNIPVTLIDMDKVSHNASLQTKLVYKVRRVSSWCRGSAAWVRWVMNQWTSVPENQYALVLVSEGLLVLNRENLPDGSGTIPETQLFCLDRMYWQAFG